MTVHYSKHLKDISLLFVTKMLRAFSYGMLSVIFFDSLFFKGVTEIEATLLQSATIAGDIVISLILTSKADCIGRLNTLMLGAVLKLITGLVYAESENLTLLFVTGIFGVLSVTGGEIGPFMAIEQSALSQLIEKCTDDAAEIKNNVSNILRWHNLLGYVGQALGCLFTSLFILFYQDKFCKNLSQITITLLQIYAGIAGLKFICYFMMKSEFIESDSSENRSLFNFENREIKENCSFWTIIIIMIINGISCAFFTQSFLAFYLSEMLDLSVHHLGAILCICNILAGLGDLCSYKLTNWIGATSTMAFIHLPSNILIILLIFVDNWKYSLIILFIYFALSQLDVPSKQALINGIVSPSQRTNANAIANIANSLGLCIAIGFNGIFMRMTPDIMGFSVPLFIAGGLKIFLDFAISCCFLSNSLKKLRGTAEFGGIQLSETHVQERE